MGRVAWWRRDSRSVWAGHSVRRTAVVAVGALVVGLLPADAVAAPSSTKHGVAISAAPHNKRIPFTRQTPRRGPSPKPFKHFNPSGHAKLPAPGSATVTLPVTVAPGLSAKATQVRAGRCPCCSAPHRVCRTGRQLSLQRSAYE